MTPERSDDDGFTLVELMLSIAILGVILSSLSMAMIVFLKNGEYTLQRDDHSSGAALLASYLDRDLASAETATPNVAVPCASGAKDLRLSWNEVTADPNNVTPRPGTDYAVAYDVVPDVTRPGRFAVERWYCTGTSGSPVDHSIVVGDLAAADFALVGTATCGAGSTPIVVVLGGYADDTTQDYRYTGCLQGRLR